MKQLTMNKRYILPIAILFLMTILLSGSAPTRNYDLQEYKQVRDFFGTYVSIHCFYERKIDISNVVHQCWERLKTIQASMNAQSTVGDVARINDLGFYGVQVRDDVYNLLKDSIEFSRLTEGAFDVTVFPLVVLWKKAAEIGQMPPEDTLEDARNKVGYKYIRLETDNIVFLEKKGMKIDLGGIAKGYAVDQVAEILEQNGLRHFLIDAGGDIYSRGLYGGKKRWKVGVQDPTKRNSIINILKIRDAAVTTSGDYERFYIINGKRFSHIINPVTGYPQEIVISATTIAPTALEADVFSTALSVMGSQEGIDLIDSLRGVEAMIVENVAGKVLTYRSKGYGKYR
ncbi:MAG: FAD:protein FMN transferase [Thermodesulfobacteriota bacterium]